VAEQRGGGRLAVRAGDGQPESPRRCHELAEQRLPGGDRKAGRLGRAKLGVARHGAQRRTDRDAIDAREVRRIVAGDVANSRRVERSGVR
jgi:hypothetical protein